MVEFNKSEEGNDFPIRIDSDDIKEMPLSEQRLRDALDRLVIVWDEKEEFAYDTGNFQYAEGVASCLEDLKELIDRNKTT